MTVGLPRIRSALYLPASNPRAIAKARTLAADMLILDLEDAVKPEDKVSAREAAIAAVAEGFGGKPVLAMVETPKGILAAADIAQTGGVVGLIAGTNDIAAELRLPVDAGREGLMLALQAIVPLPPTPRRSTTRERWLKRPPVEPSASGGA